MSAEQGKGQKERAMISPAVCFPFSGLKGREEAEVTGKAAGKSGQIRARLVQSPLLLLLNSPSLSRDNMHDLPLLNCLHLCKWTCFSSYCSLQGSYRQPEREVPG